MLRDVLRQISHGLERILGGPAQPPVKQPPGQAGPHATTQVDTVGAVTTSYNPDTDGEPDPGEVIWTWVPYEENDGRGKDRPVLIVAHEAGRTVLGVQLSSQERRGNADWVPIGSGGWDADGRPSWADISRVLRIHPEGMRREAAALPQDRFEQVVAALRDRYGWS